MYFRQITFSALWVGEYGWTVKRAIIIQCDYKVLFFKGLADSGQKENITKALNCFGPYLLNC
jgi:hypothetical protein